MAPAIPICQLRVYPLIKVRVLGRLLHRCHASTFLAAIRCRAVHAHLWDIETTDELTFVLDRIDAHIQPFDRPRIAVNFTHGRQGTRSVPWCSPHRLRLDSVLQLPRRLRGQDEILLRSNENYAMVYRPSMNGDALVTIEISKAARRISLLEKSRFERRCNHFICKRSK